MTQPCEILLVEDNPGDVVLIQEALREAGIRSRTHVAADGEQAIRFVRNEAPFETVVRPDLILLDWNLPRRSGSEVLGVIKNHPGTCDIPVVVFTTSDAEQDIAAAYKGHANSFVTKPVDVDAFFGIVQRIHAYWFSIAKLPAIERISAAAG